MERGCFHMAEIIVPDLAESITDGTIAKWLKQRGDFVEKGEFVAELETDKVNIEIVSDVSGVLTEFLVAEGDTVQVGEAIAVIKEVVEGTGKQVDTASGDSITADEKREIMDTDNDTKVTKEMGRSNDASIETLAGNNVRENQLMQTSTAPGRDEPIATPAARKLAREKGLKLAEIPATDPLGRLHKHDVTSFSERPPARQQVEWELPRIEQENVRGKSAVRKNQQEPTEARSTVPEQENKQQQISFDQKQVEIIPMARRRKIIAERLVEVQQTAAMLTTFNEVDMTAIQAMRNRRKEEFFATFDVRLGYMSFFTKAVVTALKQFPLLNAEIKDENIILKKYYDIGIAVSTDDGLVVPVIRDAERKSFSEIEKDIVELARKARENKLTLDDLLGGSFTITNGGVFGSLLSTPILNGPQVGILGMHNIQLRPVAIDETTMENRPMMYVALSYDHRIIDGKEAVSFLTKLKQLLEDPETLLF